MLQGLTAGFIEMGAKDNLTLTDMLSSINAYQMLHNLPSVKTIGLTVGGYDEDSRELWDIPEVVAYVITWVLTAGLLSTDEKLSDDTKTFISACFQTANDPNFVHLMTEVPQGSA